MHLQRTDLLLIVFLYLQLQLFFELTRTLSFDSLRLVMSGTSLFALAEVIVFVIAIIFSLKGVLLIVEAFFTTEDEKETKTKGAGYALVATAFLLVTLFIIVRSGTTY